MLVTEEVLGVTEGGSVEPDDSATPSAGADAESTVDATVSTGSGGVADASFASAGGTEASLRTRVRAAFRGRAAARLRRAITMKMGGTKRSELVVEEEEREKRLTCHGDA